jgi:ferredoxin
MPSTENTMAADADRPITAIFEDAKSVKFPARPNEIVYQAAYRAGIRLEHDCLEGACGSCKALCTQGEFEINDYSDEALMAQDESTHPMRRGAALSIRISGRPA